MTAFNHRLGRQQRPASHPADRADAVLILKKTLTSQIWSIQCLIHHNLSDVAVCSRELIDVRRPSSSLKSRWLGYNGSLGRSCVCVSSTFYQQVSSGCFLLYCACRWFGCCCLWINMQLICNVYLRGCLNVGLKLSEMVCIQSGLLDGLHRQAGFRVGASWCWNMSTGLDQVAAGGETSSSLTPLRFSPHKSKWLHVTEVCKPYNLCFDQS